MNKEKATKEINKYLEKIESVEKQLDKDNDDFDAKVEKIHNTKISDTEYLKYYKTEKRANKHKMIHNKIKRNKPTFSFAGLFLNYAYVAFYKCTGTAFLMSALLCASIVFNKFWILLFSILYIVLQSDYIEYNKFKTVIDYNRIDKLSTDSEEYLNAIESAGNSIFSVPNYLITAFYFIVYLSIVLCFIVQLF